MSRRPFPKNHALRHALARAVVTAQKATPRTIKWPFLKRLKRALGWK
jgi:hypothetical protein